LERLRLENQTKIPKAELALLGRPLPAIAAAMAKHWHLPNGLVQLLEKKPVWPKTRPENDKQRPATLGVKLEFKSQLNCNHLSYLEYNFESDRMPSSAVCLAG
jgi:hypothetical protein